MNEDELYKQIGKNIKKYRLQRGMSQDALAYSGELCRPYIGRCERAEKRPSIATIYKIATTLDVPLYKFFVFEDEKK